MVQEEPWGLHGFFSTFRLACSNLRQENEEVWRCSSLSSICWDYVLNGKCSDWCPVECVGCYHCGVRRTGEVPIIVLPEPYFSLSDSRDTSCAIRFFSEPVPQLRDSWDNTWCYRKPRRNFFNMFSWFLFGIHYRVFALVALAFSRRDTLSF